MLRCIWGWQGVSVLRGQKGYRLHKGVLELLGGVGAIKGIRACRGVRGVLGLAVSVGTHGPEGV